MNFLDLCSGIGGFRLGLEMAGHECVGFIEYDKFAVASYRAMHDTEGEWFGEDVTKLKSCEIPYADIWCFGFPCQDISVAGKQRGIRGERSGIYFSIIDLLKGKKEEDKPGYLLIENVRNLLSINGGFDFAAVLSELDEAGYDAFWQVLNSKNFGVPQNRERVFIVANLRSRGRREILPVGGENKAAIEQIVAGPQGYRVMGASGISCALQSNAGGVGAKTGLYFIDQSVRQPKLTEESRCITSRYTAGVVNHTAMNSGVLEVCPVIAPDRMEKNQNGRRMKESGDPMFTLTGQDRHGIAIREATSKGYAIANEGDSINIAAPGSKTRRGRVGKGIANTIETGSSMATLTDSCRIRRLTPRECFRLQGFPDSLFDKARAVNSDAQLYKQAGNAVTVNVAYAVAMSLPESGNNQK